MARGKLPLRAGASELSRTTILELLEKTPEEDFWLADQESPRTRRAYFADVANLVETLGIRSAAELRRVDHRAVIAWKRSMTERGDAKSTVRRRLSALSSYFKHLVQHGIVDRNPVRDVKRPKSKNKEGITPSFSEKDARALLDAPDEETLCGLRDRAILSVGFQVGARRAEIAGLKTDDFRTEQGYPVLYLHRKNDADGYVTIHQETDRRIQAYLLASKHRYRKGAPLFLPLRGNQLATKARRHLSPERIDQILKCYMKKLFGEDCLHREFRRYSAHSMRATFITVTLDKGARLEDVQAAAGHAHSSTTLLYDRRKQRPDRSATFFANYG